MAQTLSTRGIQSKHQFLYFCPENTFIITKGDEKGIFRSWLFDMTGHFSQKKQFQTGLLEFQGVKPSEKQQFCA